MAVACSSSHNDLSRSATQINGRPDFIGPYCRHRELIFRPLGGEHQKEGRYSEMTNQQANNPLHGQTLEMIVNALVAHLGWEELGRRITIRCFNSDPSVSSSLKFLRKTPWARKKVEHEFIALKMMEGP